MELLHLAIYAICALCITCLIPYPDPYTCTVTKVESEIKTYYYTDQKYRIEGFCKYDANKSQEAYHQCMNNENLLRTFKAGFRNTEYTSHILLHETNKNIIINKYMQLNHKYNCDWNGSLFHSMPEFYIKVFIGFMIPAAVFSVVTREISKKKIDL